MSYFVRCLIYKPKNLRYFQYGREGGSADNTSGGRHVQWAKTQKAWHEAKGVTPNRTLMFCSDTEPQDWQFGFVRGLERDQARALVRALTLEAKKADMLLLDCM